MLLLGLILLPFLGAFYLLFLPGGGRGFCPRFSLGTTGLCLAFLALLTWEWKNTGTLSVRYEWLPQLGLDFALWLDGPALFYSWLILGIGFLVLQYSAYYMKPDDSPYRFYASILAFLGSMLGIVLAQNLTLVFLFWEMTSLTSFLLIGHWRERPEAVAGAQRALLVTGVGGLSFLVAAVLMGQILSGIDPSARLEWDTLWGLGPRIVEHTLAGPALAFFLLAAFTKSAQFPFHFWLPGAMEAPTPVSALLHAATMVKAGVFLLGRLYPIFNTELMWVALVATVGVATMLVGGYLAVFSKDIKQLLAYSTVSQLGLLVAYYGFGYRGLGGETLLKTDLLLVASHALFKGGLFMLCGVVDHETGTRDRTRLGGLRRKMPATAWLSVLACLSMAGAPLTLGFVAKKLFLEAGLQLKSPLLYFEEALFALAILASVFTVCYSIQFAVNVFFGTPRDSQVYAKAHEGPAGLLLAPGALVIACIASGLYVPLVETPLSHLVLPDFFEARSHYTLAVFHKADFLFWTSIGVFLIGGPALYLVSEKLEAFHDRIGRRFSAQEFSDRLFLSWIPAFGERLTHIVQSPSRQRNLGVVFGVLTALTGTALYRGGWVEAALPGLGWVEGIAGATLVVVFILTGVVIWGEKMLVRLMSLGFIGLLIAFLFVLYKAPDLAITQILVELALLLMFLNLLGHFSKNPYEKDHSSFSPWIPLLAAAMGVLMGVLTYQAATSPLRSEPILAGNPTHSEFYLTSAKTPREVGGHSGGGRNVVNVVLVDFRAMDTLGEITVLAVAALGVVVLGGFRSRREEAPSESEKERTGPARQAAVIPLRQGESLVLKGTAPAVSMLTLSFAAILFFAGHNHPGGGFIAGLAGCIAAVPFSLRPGKALASFPSIPRTLWIPAAGLLVALATGAASVIAGYPFLRSTHRELDLPFVGHLELASAMAFDLGVFLVVFGITAVILRTLSRT